MTQSISLQKKLSIALNNYRMFGLRQTTKDALVYLLDRRPDDFDEKYGVQTSENVEPWEAQIGDGAALVNAIRYSPTLEVVLRHILSSVLAGEDAREFSFVDLGCGKGRTLVIASQFAFQQVIGVEISRLHAAHAEENVQRYLAHPRSAQAACRRLSVVCDNAANLELPDSDVLIYMYRPFVGAVFEAVADRLAQLRARSRRRIWIAFSCPAEDYMFARRRDFRMLRQYNVISGEYSWSLWEVQGRN
jgi:SAM-dependent methyltransferase